MSSFIGHSLVALTIHEGSKPVSSAKTNWWWIVALIVLASAPDIDYLVPLLRPVAPAAPPDRLSWWICSWMGCRATMAPHTIRVTHSFVGIFVLVGITLALLLPVPVPRRLWGVFAFQAAAVGLSHLLLDFLVSATPTAFFWPFSNTSIILPNSILPRLGEISLTNPTMYYAVLIEVVIFASLWVGIYWLKRRRRM
jgi:inner membrane protein